MSSSKKTNNNHSHQKLSPVFARNKLTTLIRERSTLALEPRVLLDAAVVDSVASAVDYAGVDPSSLHTDSTGAEGVLQAMSELDAPIVSQPNADTKAPADGSARTIEQSIGEIAARATDESQTQLLFIDDSLLDREVLESATNSGIEIIIINSFSDGLEQIAEHLEGRSDIDAVHIISHGSVGEVQLGSTSLSADNLQAYSEVLGKIGSSLSDDGDILLYGCRVAEAEGAVFVDAVASLTGADVAASNDLTGNSAAGGDWTLEYHSGEIETQLPFERSALAGFSSTLEAQVDLSGADGWVTVMSGTSFDPTQDSQAGAADLDVAGDEDHGVLYVAFDDNGTPDDDSDDMVAFRIRVNNSADLDDFGKVILIGLDAGAAGDVGNPDGRVDIFLSVDARNNTRAIRFFDPGSDLNNSPNTTSTSPLPTGWLDNNGIYQITNDNFSVVAVSEATDPHWNGNTDIGNDGATDVFVSFKIPVADLATVLGIASPIDRKGGLGPRGDTGIDGFTKDTPVRYVLMTQTQSGPINGDLAGVARNYDKNATFTELGAFTAPMSISEAVSASDSVLVESAGDGNISAAEADDVAISGSVSDTVADGTWVKVTVTDESDASVTYFVQVSSGEWSEDNADLSGLDDGTLTVRAQLWTTGDNSGEKIAGSASSLLEIELDTQAPSVTVDSGATAGTPTITGTSDLPVGSLITVLIDPDNDPSTDNSVSFVTTVLTGGVWRVPTGTATPSSGSMPSGGLTSYAKITASGTDEAGNTTTATGQNVPTVSTSVTTDQTPAIRGTWTNIDGDVLTVTVDGVEYSEGDDLVITDNTWVLTVPVTLDYDTYSVTATVSRGGSDVDDSTTSELQVVAGDTVSITSGTSTSDTRPSITGGSTVINGTIIVRIDPGNDGSGFVTYSVTTNGDGDWSLDLSSATPISGQLPSEGLDGETGILARNVDNTASTEQVLTVTTPTVTIVEIDTSLVSGDSTANIINDDAYLNVLEAISAVVSGTSTAEDGTTIEIVVTDQNNNSISFTASVTGGEWDSAGTDLSSLDNGTLTVVATISGGSASDTISITHDKNAPRIFTTTQNELRRQGTTINGTSELVNSAITVTITPDTGSVQTLNTTTDGSGIWSVDTASFDNKANTASVTVTSSATDLAGNIASAVTTDHTLSPGNSGSGTITIDLVETDDIIDSDEIGDGVVISGTTSFTAAVPGSATGNLQIIVTDADGNTITLNDGTSVTNSSGNWTATLTKEQVQSLSNGQLTVEARVVDEVVSFSLPTLTLEAPTVTITDDAPGVTDGDVTFTFSFDHEVSDFDIDDVTVVNGTKGTFTAVSATEYTLVVTPNDGEVGDVTVTVDAGNATSDKTGRGNIAAEATQSFDTLSGNVAAPDISISVDAQATTPFPVVSGTTSLPVGASIEVIIDPNGDGDLSDAVTYTAIVQSGSTWSVDLATAVPDSGSLPGLGLDGDSIIHATGTNAYGNSATVIGAIIQTITDDSGTNAADFQTNDDTLTFTGYAEPGSSVEVKLDDSTIATVAADGTTGVWSVDYTGTPLGDDTYTLTAIATDANGNTATTTQDVVIDTVGPALTIDSVTDDSGVAADWITNDTKPVFTGTATANAAVQVTLKDADDTTVFTVSVVADGSGDWSVDRSAATALPEGDYVLTAVATDTVGNETTANQNLEIDTTATITITSNYKSSDSTPVISGTTDIEVGQTITVEVSPNNDGNYTDSYNTTVQAGGTWSVEATNAVSDDISVRVSGTDITGNSATTTKEMNIDLSAPSISIETPVDNEAGQDSDGILQSDENGAVVIDGSTTDVDSGSSITVTITDGVTTITDTATVQGDGSWALDPLNLKSFLSGTLTVTATYFDSEGVQYTDTATVEHAKSGSVSIDSITSDTATPFDFTTSDNTLVFKGSAGATDTVTLTLTGPSGTFADVDVVADADGLWSYDYTGTTLSDGSYTLTAESNAVSVNQDITIDATAPSGPVTVDAFTPAADTTPTITGTATLGAGETLTVTVDGITYEVGDDLTYDSDLETWSLTIPAENALTPGKPGSDFTGIYEVEAKISDDAGNTLADATSDEVLIQDTTAPVIDLNGGDAGVDYDVTSSLGADVVIAASASASVVEASDQLQSITISVGGLVDGTSEKLVFGSEVLAADGSSDDVTGVSVGGIQVDVSYSSGQFVITRSDYSLLTQADAEAVIRAVVYRNTEGASSTAGDRTFTFRTADDTDNESAAAVTTVTVQLSDPDVGSLSIVTDDGDDDVYNPTELASDLVVSIVPPDNAEPGDTITVYMQPVDESGDPLLDGDDNPIAPVAVGTAVLPGGWVDGDAVEITIDEGDLPENFSELSATWTDSGDNEGDAWGHSTIEVDRLAPAVDIASITDDNGSSATDFITNDTQLVFTGTAEAGASVQVTLKDSSNNQEFQTTVVADGDGNWSIDRTGEAALDADSYTLTAVATDAAGNSATDTQAITIDTTAPAVAISSITDDTGSSDSDFITSDTQLVFTGTAEAGASVQVTLKDSSNNQEFQATVVADGDGNWSVDRTGESALPADSYTLTAIATDT
ncbi:MAG: Ig-like domain-containing protein, partial [Pseudohongiellaceae bacterium]|nr:Ig-like domain-containing protein [Pseudohongiellaceae bacterium]